MKAIDIPDLFQKYWGLDADPADINDIPVNSTGVPGRASLDIGFPHETTIPEGAGGTPPFGQDFNGIFRQITQSVQWSANTGSPFFYDSAFSSAVGGYPKGAVLGSTLAVGIYWISTADDNTTDPDGGSAANWTGYTPLNLYAVDSGTKNALVISLKPNPSSNDFFVGKPITIKKGASPNDGAVTINLNGGGNQPLIHSDGTVLSEGELPGHGYFTCVLDDSGNFELTSGSGSSVRSRIGSNLTLYVDGVSGSDSNDGLTLGSAFLTVQHAWDVVFSNYDLNGNAVTVLCADATNQPGLAANGRLIGAETGASFKIDSISGNAAACTFTSAGNTFSASDGSEYTLGAIKASSTGGNGVNAGFGGRININGNYIAGAATGAKFGIQNGGRIDIATNYTDIGNAPTHWSLANNGIMTIENAVTAITLSGSPSYSNAWASVIVNASLIYSHSNLSFSGSPAAGVKKFICDGNGVINSGGTAAITDFPGSVAGTKTNGGQYL